VPSWVDAAGDQQHRQSAAADQAAGADWDNVGTVGGSSRLQATLSRGLAYGLWGLLAIAVVVGLVNCAGTPSAAPPADTGDAPMPMVPPPGGCAELVVAAWLAGDTGLLADVPGVPRRQPEPGRRQATRTYTAAVTPGEHAWGYLVGADVHVSEETPEGDLQWQPAGTQFFMVTMVASDAASGCQGWRPAALPAQVPAPQLGGGDASVPYPESLPDSGTELSQTLEAFFNGLLAGTGDLERYVAPGVAIPALAPPPYQQVSVTELRARVELPAEVPADGTVAQVLVTVAATDDDLPLVYPVTVGVRGGRWEVVAIETLVGSAVLAEGEPTTSVDPNQPAERTNGG
jgi:hypothetical protein